MDPPCVFFIFSSIHWGPFPQPWVIQDIVTTFNPSIGWPLLGKDEQSPLSVSGTNNRLRRWLHSFKVVKPSVRYLLTCSSMCKIFLRETCVVPNTCTTKNSYPGLGNKVTAAAQLESPCSSPLTRCALYHFPRPQWTKAESHPQGKSRL